MFKKKKVLKDENTRLIINLTSLITIGLSININLN